MGNNGAIAHWNGNQWKGVSTSLPNENLNAVSCSSVDDCWLVGDKDGNTPLIAYYNGTIWQLVSVSQMLNMPKVNLHTIACSSASYCVVGGDNGETAIWNGSNWQGTLSGLPDRAINAITINSGSGSSSVQAVLQWQQE